ncbi:MAG: DUF167 family protein [Gammaproteobacteria bacterium]|nr:DUF167 family protein [Gammaproteobacteria bacterium]
MATFYYWLDSDLVLKIRLQPKASTNEFAEIMGDAIKIRTTAPPVDGKANKQLIEFLANIFNVARSNINILSGKTMRVKKVLIKSPRQLPHFIHSPD